MATVTIITENNPNPQTGQSVAIGDNVFTNFTAISDDPNGALSGNLNDKALNTSNSILYICTASGTASTAVWTPINDAILSEPYIVEVVL